MLTKLASIYLKINQMLRRCEFLEVKTSVADPDVSPGSRTRVFASRIPDPESRVDKIPDPHQRI
jgi:hypothetical protein